MSTTVTTPPLNLTLRNGIKICFMSNVSIEADEIPVIDIADIYSDDLAARQRVAEQVREACHRIGFFYIINHGIDPAIPEATFEAGKKFFDQPEEKKMQVSTDLVEGEYFGYHSMNAYNRNGNKYQDLMEAFNFGYDAQYDPLAVDKSEHSASIWPREEDLPGFKDAMYGYHTALLALARRLTRTFALALYMPEDYFDELVKRPEAGQRICHYPVQEASVDDQLGIGAYTDFECFTLVTQDDKGGLEVLSKSGYWIKAKPICYDPAKDTATWKELRYMTTRTVI